MAVHHPRTHHLRSVPRDGLQQPGLEEVGNGLAGVQLLVPADLDHVPDRLGVVEVGQHHLLLVGESGGAVVHLSLAVQHGRHIPVDVEVEGLGAC
ncbi:MAG: hypothetical protein IPO28_08115 [Holophagaceae bacterium]|nr:hypothetical protein [Holophagaceae bacterium]